MCSIEHCVLSGRHSNAIDPIKQRHFLLFYHINLFSLDDKEKKTCRQFFFSSFIRAAHNEERERKKCFERVCVSMTRDIIYLVTKREPIEISH
jgi:hypothetical protein